MPFKFTPEGQIVTQEINGQKLPVFVHADGKEVPFDADSALGKISQLNGESKQHREAKEAAETDRKSTRLNSSHLKLSRMPSSA